MNIEIERKFLLKSIPKGDPVETIDIFQWYLKNSEGIWERARSCYSDVKGFYFVHTVKKNIAPGINEEDEKEISSDEFNQFVESCKLGQSKFISKKRMIYPDGELKWEVDIFNNGYHLIVAEIEVPSMDYEVKVPKFINDKLLIEVTGMKQFGNRNLSNKYVTKNQIKSQTPD